MSRMVKGVLVLAAVVGLHQGVSAAGTASGTSMPSMGGSSPAPKSPAEMARETYNNGIEHKDKAKKLEGEFASQIFRNPKDQEKAEGKNQEKYFIQARFLSPSSWIRTTCYP